jgi:hypothetical protein
MTSRLYSTLACILILPKGRVTIKTQHQTPSVEAVLSIRTVQARSLPLRPAYDAPEREPKFAAEIVD